MYEYFKPKMKYYGKLSSIYIKGSLILKIWSNNCNSGYYH